MTFSVGQRVRINEYPHTSPSWGDPHFIVGHFGHIERFIPCGLIDVRISRGPNGGPPDDRVELYGDWVWPMWEHELEAVD